MPSGGVPMLFPRPSIASGWRPGAMISRLSAPRTQWGTLTGSRRTFSRPSWRIWSAAHLMAASKFSEPLSRPERVSELREAIPGEGRGA